MNILLTCLISYSLLLVPLLVAGHFAAGGEKQGDKDSICSAATPQSICDARTTCGSRSTPCVVNVKRGSHSASATPSIPEAKGNARFCVKAGTTVTWQSSSKSTGFILDFGDSSPFESQTTITGGSKRSASVVAQKPGCFKFSVSACREAAISGMCESGRAELVVIADEN
jgi:hypothetical protein